MSVFSETTKAELARVQPGKECCLRAEFAALMRADATVKLGTSRRYVSFRTETAAVARKIYNSLKESFGIPSEIIIVRKNRLRKNVVYIVQTRQDSDFAAVLGSSAVMGHVSVTGSPEAGVEAGKAIVTQLCCVKAYLRGTFLGCGSVMSPARGYHLEFVLDDANTAEFVSGLAGRFGIRLRSMTRKGRVVCYLKDADEISQMLALMGAGLSVLDLESIRVVKEMRNGVNRLVNCETANVDKAVAASLRQGDAIRFLARKVGLKSLPDVLGELASLRLQYPDVCLRELGELTTPKLGKSGVNHRMRRLVELAVENGFQPFNTDG